MKKLSMLCTFVMVMCMGVLTLHFSTEAFAQVAEVPVVNVWEKLGELVLGWAGMSTTAKGIGFVMILTQVAKQAADFQYKRIVVFVLSVAYGVLISMTEGVSVTASLTAMLLSGGGAMVLYEMLKPILKTMSMFDFLKLSKND